jgi:hypothetical protein
MATNSRPHRMQDPAVVEERFGESGKILFTVSAALALYRCAVVVGRIVVTLKFYRTDRLRISFVK